MRITDSGSDFDVWNAPLRTIGGTPVTLLYLFTLITLSVVLIATAARLQRLLANRLLSRQRECTEPAAIVDPTAISGNALKFELIVWMRRADWPRPVSRHNFAIREQLAPRDIKIA